MGMDKIRSILANNQPNHREPYGEASETNQTENQEDNGVSTLAEILKTGYQTRKFSNTPTLDWLQTWRVSNLASCESK